MANPEHLEQLKKGVTSWSTWRAANPDIKPDLSGVNLRSFNFIIQISAEAYSVRANLSNTNFRYADLTHTNLNGINLTGVNLQNSILIKTNLEETNTSGTQFGGSNLTNATLPKEFNFEKDLEIFDEASKIARKHFAWLMWDR